MMLCLKILSSLSVFASNKATEKHRASESKFLFSKIQKEANLGPEEYEKNLFFLLLKIYLKTTVISESKE